MIDVYWWSKVKSEKSDKENFGDLLVPFLLSKLTSLRFRWSRPHKKKYFKVFKKKHYLMIGSIIRFANLHSIVWGSGIIDSNDNVAKATFLGVRGPHTRKRLLSLGYNVPERYGDPALLLALFFKQNKNQIKYKYGIIPHYVDYDEVCKDYANVPNVKVIDVLTNTPETVIDEILKCEFTLSSSLHGIIVSHALGIPSLWLKVSDRLTGDDIKFYDYFDSLHLNIGKHITYKQYNVDELDEIFRANETESMPLKKNLNKVLLDLIKSFPFKKSKQFKRAIKTYFSNE